MCSQMMDAASVSKEKFAYILKSLGPTLPSIVPISRYCQLIDNDYVAVILLLFCCDDGFFFQLDRSSGG